MTVHSIDVDGDIAYLTYAVPVPLLNDIRSFFESTVSIMNYVKLQLKYKLAEQKARDSVHAATQKKLYDRFVSRVVSQFDSLTAIGLSPREAIKGTRDFLREFGDDVTCSTIEVIVRQAGCLSKKKGRSPLWEKKATS